MDDNVNAIRKVLSVLTQAHTTRNPIDFSPTAFNVDIGRAESSNSQIEAVSAAGISKGSNPLVVGHCEYLNLFIEKMTSSLPPFLTKYGPGKQPWLFFVLLHSAVTCRFPHLLLTEEMLSQTHQGSRIMTRCSHLRPPKDAALEISSIEVEATIS